MYHILSHDLSSIIFGSSSTSSCSKSPRNDPFTSPHRCIWISPNNMFIPSQSRLSRLVIYRGHSRLVMNYFISDQQILRSVLNRPLVNELIWNLTLSRLTPPHALNFTDRRLTEWVNDCFITLLSTPHRRNLRHRSQLHSEQHYTIKFKFDTKWCCRISI